MAAISCYQPCRPHLAQPARCFDDEIEQHPATGSLSLRRRQFIERCHEARGTRHPDAIPEVSVRRTREELARNAAQTATLNRRLNVESGWSKVEEVRKKFESAAATTPNYSRSFESPPRRRLADSLFASFKLPRKKTNMAASRSLAPQPHQKRKSAVELLAETKAFYVKSETVLDRKQELPLRVGSALGQAIASGGCRLISSGTVNNDVCCNSYGASRSGSGTRRGMSACDGLQSTLRRLLEHADSGENVYSPPFAVSHKMLSDTRRLKDPCGDRELSRSHHASGTFSGTSSSGTSGSKVQRTDIERDKINRPLSFGDARVFFPESFVVPRQRPSEVIIKRDYSILSSHSSPEELLPETVLACEASPEHLAAISPPAQYAHSGPRYVRSNSHCQGSVREDPSSNINSHKSLPDLHTETRVHQEQVTPEGGTGEWCGRSPRRRRSSHHRTASCSSKGTRSNHSSAVSSCEDFSERRSPGDDNYHSYTSRCGSSFARDSGGSSGHCTQRSAPPHAPPGSHYHQHHPHHQHQHRTDSGSSTQHDHNSSRYNPYYGDGAGACVGPGVEGGVPLECYVSAPPQFQDGAPSPPPPPLAHYPPPLAHPPPRVGIHFQASAPPPQFQDEPSAFEYECGYKAPLKCLSVGRKDYGNTRDYTRYHEHNSELISRQPAHQESRPRVHEYLGTQTCAAPAGGGGCAEDVLSPPGTFRRQRCLRYKQRRPRTILRSKSDISDRYRRADGRSPASAPCEGEDAPDSGSEGSARLRHFFERLGLEPRQYDALLRDSDPDSPVFFSSASTVDSNQITAAADYTVQGPGGVAGAVGQKQIYRNTEPPSVVERNARIIKWLCQCRKTLVQPPQ